MVKSSILLARHMTVNSKQILIGNLKKNKNRVMFCARHFFIVKCKCSKYCFDCFLFAGGDKVGSLADVEFKAGKYEIPGP